MLCGTPGGLPALGAKLLARVVESDKGAIVDIWAPGRGIAVSNVLTPPSGLPPKSIRFRRHAKIPLAMRHTYVRKFFKECLVQFRHSYIPYCGYTNTTQNLFGKMSHHVVSLATGIPGCGSAARGDDMCDGSEIKQALGSPKDAMGMEDWPRLDLGSNKKKMLSWTNLYAVRVMCPEGKLKLKVSKANIREFRKQVKTYFSRHSKHRHSTNLQYHVPKSFEGNVYSGESGIADNPRNLHFKPIFKVEE